MLHFLLPDSVCPGLVWIAWEPYKYVPVQELDCVEIHSCMIAFLDLLPSIGAPEKLFGLLVRSLSVVRATSENTPGPWLATAGRAGRWETSVVSPFTTNIKAISELEGRESIAICPTAATEESLLLTVYEWKLIVFLEWRLSRLLQSQLGIVSPLPLVLSFKKVNFSCWISHITISRHLWFILQNTHSPADLLTSLQD